MCFGSGDMLKRVEACCRSSNVQEMAELESNRALFSRRKQKMGILSLESLKLVNALREMVICTVYAILYSSINLRWLVRCLSKKGSSLGCTLLSTTGRDCCFFEKFHDGRECPDRSKPGPSIVSLRGQRHRTPSHLVQ